MFKPETINKRQPVVDARNSSEENPRKRLKSSKRFIKLEAEYNKVNSLKSLLDSHYTVKIENHKVIEILPEPNNIHIFQNYNGFNALEILLSHAGILPIDIVERLFKKLRNSDYIVDEIVDALAEAKCELDRVVLLGDPRITLKMVEVKCKGGYPSIRKAVKQTMSLVDLDNLKALLHCESIIISSRETFIVELKNILLDLRPDIERAKLLLQALMTCNNLRVTNPTFDRYFSQVFHETSTEVVQLLLDCEFDKYARNTCNFNFLMYLFGNKNVDATDLLRNRPFDVNARHNDNTALKLAVKYGPEKNVRWLLDKGALINCPKDQDTPLTLAVESRSTSMIDLLLERGANMNFQDSYRANVLHVAHGVEIVQFLLLRGANAQSMTNQGRTVFENKPVSESSLILAHLALVRMQRVLIVTPVVEKIKSNTEYSNFWDKCLQQLRWMKTQRAYGLTTMYDIVCEKVGRVTRGMDLNWIKEKILDCARDGQLDPYYVTLLDCKFESVFFIQELKRNAGWVLSEAMGIFGVDLVIDKIIDFLTFQDLIVFK